MNNQQIEQFRKSMENHKQIAIRKNGKLHRILPGLYFIYLDAVLLEIEQLDEGPDSGWWIARESEIWKGWYSDPYPTLKELKNALGVN